MRSLLPIRFTAAVSLAFCPLLVARSLHVQSPVASHAKPVTTPPPAALHATPPTVIPVVPELPKTPAQLPPHPADVTFADGVLSISASNSSLNQILRDVSHQTGMKITGGVVDERVFGQYGPAPAGQVLTALLEGTGSNVLLIENGGVAPGELILTPRQGGATPPNPNASAMEENEQLEDQGPKQTSQSGQQPVPNAVPVESVPPVTRPPETGEGTSSSQPDSPNGVKTPQQIYDQLQRMRQQQAQQQEQQTNPQ
jgi:hypothetical protein